jgi:secondary thiamine-phosphate synthase enzyme
VLLLGKQTETGAGRILVALLSSWLSAQQALSQTDKFRRQSTTAFPYETPEKEIVMKSLTKHLWFEVPSRRGFLNITPQIAALVEESGVREGLCLVNAMHITASVFINDDESGLHRDMDRWLEHLAPHAPVSQYEHNVGEDNADAHLKRSVMGREVVVAITGGQLDFGPWEQIFYGEFDGRRRKRVLVKIIGE